MKNCSICKAAIEAETPSILTMGAYGNPRYVCEDCDREIERMLLSRDTAEIAGAMKTLGDHLSRIGCEDTAVIETMEEMVQRATDRAKRIAEGTYDFSEDEQDPEVEELVEIPEELQETEEDRALDEKDAEIEKKWDKVMNLVWYITLGVFAAAFIFLLIRRFF
ncbi:MAG: hypothetical protein IJW11_05435 [Clostridia bacterium]|nr:hypothetical protein [Clostridia bacterium]